MLFRHHHHHHLFVQQNGNALTSGLASVLHELFHKKVCHTPQLHAPASSLPEMQGVIFRENSRKMDKHFLLFL